MKILIGKATADTRIIGNNGVDLTTVLSVKRITIEVDAKMAEPRVLLECIADVEVGNIRASNFKAEKSAVPTHTPVETESTQPATVDASSDTDD